MKDFAFTLARDTNNTGPITITDTTVIIGIGGIIGTTTTIGTIIGIDKSVQHFKRRLLPRGVFDG